MPFSTFSLPQLLSHPPAAEAHEAIVFCWLTPALYELQLFKICCSLPDIWEISCEAWLLDVCILHVTGEMVVTVFWELWAQTNEFTNHKQHFLETCSLYRGQLGADHHCQYFSNTPPVLCMSSAGVWQSPGFYQMLFFVLFVRLGIKYRE